MPYPRHCEPKAKQSRASARKPGALALGCFVAPLLATTERGEHKSFTGLDVNPYTSRIPYSPSTVTGQLSATHRKRVGEGKRVSVRVDSEGRRYIKKKTTTK